MMRGYKVIIFSCDKERRDEALVYVVDGLDFV